MKILAILSLVLLSSCNRDDRHPTPGEAAGRSAYEVEKDAKKAAKEISKDLKNFQKDAKQGFEEQKQKDLEHKKTRDEPEPKP